MTLKNILDNILLVESPGSDVRRQNSRTAASLWYWNLEIPIYQSFDMPFGTCRTAWRMGQGGFARVE